MDGVLAELGTMEPQVFSALHLALATNGSFTKRTRPVADAAARSTLERFRDATLTSVHPS